MNPTRSGADPFLCPVPQLGGTDEFAAALGSADMFKDYTFVDWDEPKSTTADARGDVAPTVTVSAARPDAATLQGEFATVEFGMPVANAHVTMTVSPDTYNPLTVADEDAPVLESGNGITTTAAPAPVVDAMATGTIHGFDAAAAIKVFEAIVPFLAHPMIGRARQHVGNPFETPSDAILGLPAPVPESVEPEAVESLADNPTIALNSRKTAVNCPTLAEKECAWPKGFIAPTAPINAVRGAKGKKRTAIEADLTEEAISQLPVAEQKRIRNTISARMSRARKEARVQALEEECRALTEKVETAEQKYKQALKRIRELEELLQQC
ncbi:hypothetical protein AMAG_14655 [Allomyces macrogynus ATCC 38327]|uniref:Uncharacterized protein n=1 Tax=Allomyces macrogynus (strain ATCC 38327) TaxID=578462 RepID=A0A0L0T718_ALLM3|nr:hypothetical protein AMAG_14655 [Allomyces macrogynus ATCC 38327]|eukprot:KNE70532.1 hypothetical protein AMAG_14655 [Allomyces macrogynus ATCC 38327]